MREPDAAEERDAALALEATRRWLDLAVIGLNLCPFARPVRNGDRIRFCVSRARTKKALRADLRQELERLAGADPEHVETTLLIHPWALQDFYAFNDFLAEADAVLEELDLVGTLQIASFHPRYQFADSDPDDVTNATNRAPYPTLHLLRETSIERAVRSMADPAVIYERNMATLRGMGENGWRELQRHIDGDADLAARERPTDRDGE